MQLNNILKLFKQFVESQLLIRFFWYKNNLNAYLNTQAKYNLLLLDKKNLL